MGSQLNRPLLNNKFQKWPWCIFSLLQFAPPMSKARCPSASACFPLSGMESSTAGKPTSFEIFSQTVVLSQKGLVLFVTYYHSNTANSPQVYHD